MRETTVICGAAEQFQTSPSGQFRLLPAIDIELAVDGLQRLQVLLYPLFEVANRAVAAAQNNRLKQFGCHQAGALLRGLRDGFGNTCLGYPDVCRREKDFWHRKAVIAHSDYLLMLFALFRRCRCLFTLDVSPLDVLIIRKHEFSGERVR